MIRGIRDCAPAVRHVHHAHPQLVYQSAGDLPGRLSAGCVAIAEKGATRYVFPIFLKPAQQLGGAAWTSRESSASVMRTDAIAAIIGFIWDRRAFSITEERRLKAGGSQDWLPHKRANSLFCLPHHIS
jgi:hypothetical protein